METITIEIKKDSAYLIDLISALARLESNRILENIATREKSTLHPEYVAFIKVRAKMMGLLDSMEEQVASSKNQQE